MLKIRHNKIFMTRGDTVSLKVDITDYNGDPYSLSDGDKAIFRLKKKPCDTRLLIEKKLDIDEEGQLYLIIVPEDTENLKFGVYYYEIEVIIEDDCHYTIIDNSPLELGKELENHVESKS